jgi:lipopolysaccharide assembly protein A
MSTEPQPVTESPPVTEAPPATSPQLDAPQLDTPPTQPAPQPPHTIRHTRISGLWFAVAVFALVLLFLLIFILQNGRGVGVSYLGAHGHLPLGVALLLSAVCGALLVILAGAARMAQLHSVARRHRRIDAKRQASTPNP